MKTEINRQPPICPPHIYLNASHESIINELLSTYRHKTTQTLSVEHFLKGN